MSMKLTDHWLETFVVALVVFSSFSFDGRAVNKDVSISILKTTTIEPWLSLELFCGMPNKFVS